MKRYIIYLLSIFVLISCSKGQDTITNNGVNYSPKFYAEIDNTLTRTYVNDALKVCWSENDKLSVFTSTANQQYQFDGNTGDLEGTFSVVEMNNSTTGSSLSVDANYAVYPYSEETTISSDGTLTFVLPQNQVYVPNSFGINSNPMIAVTENKNDTYLSFKNICGYLRVSLYGDSITAKSIRLEGNSSECISGKANVSISYGQEPIITLTDDALHSITLDCQDGVQIGESASDATEIWFVLPPVTFENGFTIIIEDISGNKYIKSTEKKIEVKRNTISNMAISKVEQKLEYQLFNKEIDGIDAAMTNDGNYCALVEVNNESKQMLAIFGNTASNLRDYVLMDSLGIIHNFTLGEDVYSLIYGDNNVSVFCNDTWKCDIPYEKFHDSDNTETRASILTRNPIYKLASKISIITDVIKAPRKTIILAVLQTQLGDNDDLLNFLVDAIDGIDLLEAINWIDRMMDINYFGDAYISTLEPCEVSVCNYNLGCYTQLPSLDTPFYKENSHRGVSYTFKVTMNLKEDCVGGEEYSKESEPLNEETWFNFQNLNLNSKYRYEPKLEVEYSISDEAYWLSIGEDPQKIGAQTARRSLYGEELSFTTGLVGSSVEEVENKKSTSADVICSFSDVPSGAECQILITKEGADISQIFSGQPDCENQKVSVSGLTPSTTYIASSRIIYKGTPYDGTKSVSFSTLGPSGYLISIPEEQITTTSAIVKCQFSNVESGVECGIIVKGKDGSSKTISASNVESEQEVTISGLQPATQYTCTSYVKLTHSQGSYYKEGNSLSFTTDLPDVTGTWICKEKNGEYYTSYTVTLYKDGTATTSLYDNYESATWSHSKAGLSVRIIVMTSYFNGHYWAGSDIGRDLQITFDDSTNPTSGKGSAHQWVVGAATGISHDTWYGLEMTR